MTRKVIVFIFIFAFVFSFASFYTSKTVFSADCSDSVYAKAHEAYCRNELKKVEAEYASLLQQVEKLNKQSSNYASELKKLTTQINALKTKIKARNLAIAQLKNDINNKVSKINSLSEKIEREHESLAQLLRNTNEFDNENFIYLILSDESISDFYSDLESYNSIKLSIKNSVEEITGVKAETEVQKKELETKKDAETDAKYELESAQKKAAQLEAENKKLLSSSKTKEEAFKILAEDKKARAAKIRSALFNLAGTSQKIDFGTALTYATEAKTKLGIDPAFLMAILTQESNLGANVGSCYVTNTTTGAGKGANTGSAQIRVMHPTRDIPVFLSIVNKLGLDYTKTRVSCWIPAYNKDGSPYGWGGAMGPAQFIPSTWKIFETRLKSVLGHDANPWTPKDAFMASAMYLTDLGAVGNSASSQSKAACKYYGSGGATCAYSNSVMKIKLNIQANIDLLSD